MPVTQVIGLMETTQRDPLTMCRQESSGSSTDASSLPFLRTGYPVAPGFAGEVLGPGGLGGRFRLGGRDWVPQIARNLVMDLQDAATAKYLIRDRDAKFTQAFDAVFTGAGIQIVTCAVRTPRMNSIMERWVQTCRRELLDAP